MDTAVIYIHGKGGTAAEANHYAPLFPDCSVIGFDYSAQTPWEAKAEFPDFFRSLQGRFDRVILIANSIGACLAMYALAEQPIAKAFFISPVVDMEKLISDMLMWVNATEAELKERKVIETPFGETLSWEYLRYVREHPINWRTPTHILYGSCDNLTSMGTISAFAGKIGASLTVMEQGEHWFHNEKQMQFLDNWIKTLV